MTQAEGYPPSTTFDNTPRTGGKKPEMTNAIN